MNEVEVHFLITKSRKVIKSQSEIIFASCSFISLRKKLNFSALNKVSAYIIQFIDFFYPPFKRIMPEQTFRYAVCGASNTVLGLTMYYVCFYYFLRQHNFDLGFFAFKPHIAALFFSFCISFVVGFALMKYVVFVDSNLRGKIQLFRYFSVFALNLCINYIMLKLLVEVLHLPAMISQVLTTFIMIVVSYLAQRHFTFKVKK